jgi:hypothetical protein
MLGVFCVGKDAVWAGLNYKLASRKILKESFALQGAERASSVGWNFGFPDDTKFHVWWLCDAKLAKIFKLILHYVKLERGT